MKRMRIFRSPLFMAVVGLIAGVMMADTLKPMLGKLPLVGSMFNK